MARKNGYTAEQMIDAIQKANGIKAAAARVLGCSRTTIDRYIANYATVAQAYEESRETLIDMAEGKLFEQIKGGNITAIIFALKTIGKHRGYVERIEQQHSGEVNHVVNWDDDDLHD